MKTRISDLLLPLLVVAVVGMMIFPLPPSLLDVLLMFNIALSVCLLVNSVYLTEPERFTSLPTILLVSTLFRLSLNISTTRQLLSKGEAPEIVAAFGNFVVSGNLVVGIVIFSIVTLVQFLVIAKGAERVAEVAARFTLDAMPGKQMAIDADVRSGILSLVEARERRKDLQRESKLFGALDGAMKFVKGDAIAGIILTLINIGAGFLIGVYQRGLSVSDSLHQYTIFTVGDGLVTQIPALLVAVAAGICVTRVSDRENSFLGRELFSQLGREPQALSTTGIMLLLLAITPGLPALPFLGAAVAFLVLASRKRRSQSEVEKRASETQFQPRVFAPLVLRLSPPATRILQREAKLPNYIRDIRNEVFVRSGVIVPEIQFDVDPTRDDTAVSFLLRGVRLDGIARQTAEPVRADGTFSQEVRDSFRSFLSQHLVDLVDDTHTRCLLDAHSPVAEDLINSVVPTQLGITALTTILRNLVLEHVSIRELRTILQAVAEFYLPEQERLAGRENRRDTKGMHTETNHAQLRHLLVEIRIALARVISENIADENWKVRGWIVETGLDNFLARVGEFRSPIEPGIAEVIADVVRKHADLSAGSREVVVASRFGRPILAEILRNEQVRLPVIGVEELSQEVELDIQGVLNVELSSSASQSASLTEPNIDDNEVRGHA